MSCYNLCSEHADDWMFYCGKKCPLCDALSDLVDFKYEKVALEDEINKLKEKYDDLQSEIDRLQKEIR